MAADSHLFGLTTSSQMKSVNHNAPPRVRMMDIQEVFRMKDLEADWTNLLMDVGLMNGRPVPQVYLYL